MTELTREDKVKAKIWLDQLSAAADRESKRLSGELADEAREEYRRTRMIPTWRMPNDLATVAASASREAVVVVDEKVFTKWVQARYPEEVETVTRVRSSWQAVFFKRLTRDGVSAIDGDEVVPGLVVKPGGEFLGVSVRPSPAAKEVYGLVAETSLLRFALDANAVLALPTGGDDE